MIFSPSPSTKEELANLATATKSETALDVNATMGQIGPIVGHMEIVECEDSYLFCVFLPMDLLVDFAFLPTLKC
ncbi:hypothetical protein REPUB_Repub06bG0021000 [Reevesia pubescens]